MRIQTLVIASLVASQMAGAQSRVSARVTFDANTAVLSAASDSTLKPVLDFLIAKPDITQMRIEGHVEGAGSGTRNEELSEQRALAVARWLVAAGVSCKRLVVVGFGNTKPAVALDSPDHASANNRIEFMNAALRGHLIGGMPADGGGKAAGDPC